MRAFIAIKIPSDIKDYLAKLQAQLKLTGADVKWVEPANIHLTLKFLGEIPQDTAKKVSQVLKDIAKTRAEFMADIKDLGAFPKINFPKVIWVGIDQGKQEIEEIAKELEERLSEFSLPKEERQFNSHLTIGRVKANRNIAKLIKELLTLGEEFKRDSRKFVVQSITLYKSTLTPNGPLYEALTEENLKS